MSSLGYGSIDGWLGFIIGDKIFIDFTKYEFEDSIKVRRFYKLID